MACAAPWNEGTALAISTHTLDRLAVQGFISGIPENGGKCSVFTLLFYMSFILNTNKVADSLSNSTTSNDQHTRKTGEMPGRTPPISMGKKEKPKYGYKMRANAFPVLYPFINTRQARTFRRHSPKSPETPQTPRLTKLKISTNAFLVSSVLLEGEKTHDRNMTAGFSCLRFHAMHTQSRIT